MFRSPDLSAAKHADVLFVKMKENGESDLAVYCEKEGIKHIKFRTFREALPIMQAVISGAISVEEALGVEEVGGWSLAGR